MKTMEIWCFSGSGQGKALGRKIQVCYDIPVLRDITGQAAREAVQRQIVDQQIILIFPVYAGNVPQPVASFLTELHGERSRVIMIALWGNAHWGNTLSVADRILQERGFSVNGAAAVVARHTYLGSSYPMDMELDENIINFLDDALKNEVQTLVPVHRDPLPERILCSLPKGSVSRFAVKLSMDAEKCIGCKRCVRACPTGAMDNTYKVHNSQCIRCMSCVSVCRAGARTCQIKGITRKALSHHMREKQSSEFFI